MGVDVRPAIPGIVIALLGVLPFVLVATLSSVISFEALGPWTREDGVVEWIGAGAWSLAHLTLREHGAGASAFRNIDGTEHLFPVGPRLDELPRRR